MPTVDTIAQLSSALAGRYAVEREIGAGGMATVFLARDLKHDRQVALKVLKPELAAVVGAERFVQEIKTTASLQHPNLLPLFDSGEANGLLFYVMPYVEGESLRARLDREKQLPVDEAVRIAVAIAGALDYAHRRQVIHRDLKPENVLLHEGQPLIADFGIALAVTNAGGARLTQTGLSLGTPQYMSPEQATSDRALDARSDIYSLGAVLYEMLAGEPPVTGATPQVMVAKLLTERPARLRMMRASVTDSLERVVDKALAKVPADRFSSAAEFARALGAAGDARPMATGAARSRTMLIAASAAAAVVVLAVGAWIARASRGGAARPGAALRDRVQITSNGRVRFPAISGDGKTLAYVVSNCRPTGCSYGIELQDVGGSASRVLFDGATSLVRIEWSADRRNLLFLGTVNGTWGTYLISALGGAPHRVGPQMTTFSATGDSLVSTRALRAGKSFWVLVSALDGVVRDSIEVAGAGDALVDVVAVPGSGWLLAEIEDKDSTEIRAIDRQGREGSRVRLWHFVSGQASDDALWGRVRVPGSNAGTIVRLPFDRRSGRLGTRPDTLWSGVADALSVTADGSALVIGEGTFEYNAWTTDFPSALRGAFSDKNRVLHATSPISLQISKDGARLAVSRQAGVTREAGQRWSVMPFAGGAETPLSFAGFPVGVDWTDATTLEFLERTASGVRLGLINATTQARHAELNLREEPAAATGVPGGGWAWIRPDLRTIDVQLPADTSPREFPIPRWFRNALDIHASPNGKQAAFTGWNEPSMDTLGVAVVSLADGSVTQWIRLPAENGEATWLDDGALLFMVWETAETVALYRVRGPGRVERLGSVPRPLMSFDVAPDLRRASAVARDYHGDAWMSRLVRP